MLWKTVGPKAWPAKVADRTPAQWKEAMAHVMRPLTNTHELREALRRMPRKGQVPSSRRPKG